MDEIDGVVENDVEVVVGWFDSDENDVFIDGGDVDEIEGEDGQEGADGSIKNSDPCERINSSSGLHVFDSSWDKIKSVWPLSSSFSAESFDESFGSFGTAILFLVFLRSNAFFMHFFKLFNMTCFS